MITVRRFREEDAVEVAKLIQRNFLEININDYSIADMKKMAEIFNETKVISLANLAHSYVAIINDAVVGCGSIAPYLASIDQSLLLTIFVSPDYHRKGIGRKIVKTLERDEYFLRAKRIEIPSSITACEFYRKLGYDYKNGIKSLDEDGHYLLEKFRLSNS